MLAFHFGSMGSGKSAHAMMTAHHRHRPHAAAHQQTAVLATTLDRRADQVSSRTGMTARALRLTPGAVRAEQFGDADTIVVDEAQFLTVGDVEALAALSNDGREVICYGLRTDFRGRLFPASARLLEIADEVHQIPLEPLCSRCERTSVVNARVIDGAVTTEGPQVALGDVQLAASDGLAAYEPLCLRCWYDAVGGPPVQ